jgi:hypothetical protein
LQLDNSGIEELVKQYDSDAKALKSELLRIVWYMRGGLSYNEAHLMTHEEREIIADIIKGNLEITKESGLPFF